MDDLEIERLTADIRVKARLLTAQTQEIGRLRAALEGIDAIAFGKKVGAAKKMQVLAREALAFSNGAQFSGDGSQSATQTPFKGKNDLSPYTPSGTNGDR